MWVEGFHVGYLSQEHAAKYHRYYSAGTTDLRAKIVGEEEDYGVEIWVPFKPGDADS